MNTHMWRSRSIVALLALGVLLSACGPSAPVVASVADRRMALEADLAKTPASTDPSTTVRRGRLLRALGQQDKALEELSAAVEAARERLNWNELALLWREMGAVHLELGQAEKALDIFGKRLKAAASLEEVGQRASALVDTGYAFALLGHVGQADEAVVEARLIGGDDLERDPVTVERLGLIADILRDAARGRLLLQQAADAYRAQGDSVSSIRAQVMAAQIASREDGDVAALARLDAQVESVADAGPAARLRRYQAEADLLEGNYDACERRATKAVELSDARGLQPIAKIARVIAARCADKNGKLDDAIRFTREAGSIVELELRGVAGDVARQRLGFEAFQIYRLLFTLEAKRKGDDRVERAFIASERARARAHLDAVARNQLGNLAATLPVSPALARDKEEAKARVRRMTQALLQRRAKSHERHERALWALEAIKEVIARQNPLLSRVSQPEPADIDDVRSHLLSDDGVLLSYFMTDEQVFVFAIDGADKKLVKLDSSAEEVADAIAAFRKRHLLRPGSSLRAVKQAAKKLYAMLLAPVAERLDGKKRITVIPHGAIGALPFESLVDPKGKYLVESFDVSYSVSATLALVLAKRSGEAGPARKGFVGMGDPVYDWAAFSGGKAEGTSLASTRALELWTAASDDASDKPRGLDRLPGTARELRDISRLFGADQKLYLRAQANEEVAKQGKLSGYRIVHIASHGLLSGHYSALALTLKPNASEDGFLMNSEIAELKLDADLVVLSACRTGNTNRSWGTAEPVAGLALSLRSAGARRVVLSLWSVGDDETAKLMLEFYRPLVKSGADYASSLGAAKRKMINDSKWAHPYGWAAFVLHGG
jgi:CHAT domain-containing protein